VHCVIATVGFEVLTAVVKSTIFWDITLCSSLKVNRRFGALLGTYFDASFFFGSFFDPKDGSDMFLRNVG
jgi:hypothetical protein